MLQKALAISSLECVHNDAVRAFFVFRWKRILFIHKRTSSMLHWHSRVHIQFVSYVDRWIFYVDVDGEMSDIRLLYMLTLILIMLNTKLYR